MFYDVFTSLCEKKDVTPNRALTDCGISRTSPAKWREGATPRGVTLQKLADYFGVTTDYLLTGAETKKAPTSEGEREVTDRQIKAAFFHGADMTEEEMDAAWEDVMDLRDIVIRKRKRDAGGK